MSSYQRIRLSLAWGVILPLGLLLAVMHPGPLASQPPAARPKDPNRPAEKQPAMPASWVSGFNWRSIGPCNMSGRIVALSVYEADPTVWWAATASGGLLKTTNAGFTLEHQFDKETTVCIGDVCVAPSDKNIVWVGTGENNPRNSVSYGNGVYKSTDGGKTWKHMGLDKTYQIGRVVVHPTNPDIVYVGALGRLYGTSSDRGLYKTTNGGKDWERILYIDDKTGIIDIAMTPGNPESLLVASWERQRDGFDSWPGEVKKPDGLDGYDPIKRWGKGSTLFRTTDGGKTFKKLTAGLPTSAMGRIGLDICKSKPNIVYAIVDSETYGKGVAPVTTYLGLVCQDSQDRTSLVQVQKDSPAEKAGLKVGDTIEEVAGKPVKTFDALLDVIRPRKVGEVVAVKYARDGKSEEVKLTLARRPGAAGGRAVGGAAGKGGVGKGGAGKGGAANAPSPVYLGIIGEDDKEGARLTQITEDSPAEKAGLKVNDVIRAVEGKKIADYEALLASLRDRKVDEKVKFDVKRGTETKEIIATLAQRPGIGGGAGPGRTRPYGAQLAGQTQNIQDQQGSKGFDTGGVYRSSDGGETWVRVNSLNPRPMYFGQIRVDPSDPEKVYILGVSYYRSVDGGVTFTADLGRGVHADGHAMWIDPRDGRHMLIGCDGGIYESRDRGANWDHLNHAAIGQFYHVALSPNRPYYVYGGLQDNGSWGGPAELRGPSGPVNEDWLSIGGGDGFTCRVDQGDPDWVYFTSQGGAMGRRNLKTGERGSIRPPRAQGKAGTHRFNWSTPFILSSHNPRIFYAGSQFVLRSYNRGDDLRVISPEITLTKRGSMTALAESPRNPEVLWAGTDDGGLAVTRNGGKDWKMITPKELGIPAPLWVSSIEASRFSEGRAYVCLDAHRSDDDKPYLFVTEDFGATWKSINANLPTFGSTRVLREDISNDKLLYCGTEFNIFASIDRGESWTKLNNNLPTVAIHEVAIHPTAGEIVVATHGRSLWALDVTALRQIKPEHVRTTTAMLYKPATVERFPLAPARGRTNRRFTGENPTPGAHLWYTVPEKAESVKLEIFDVEGKPVRELRAPTGPGLHRVTWELTKRAGAPAGAAGGRGGRGGAGAGAGAAGGGGRGGAGAGRPGGGAGGGFAGGTPVPEGTYKVVLTVDGKTLSQPLMVKGEVPTIQFRMGGEEDEEKEEARENKEREIGN